MIPTLKAFHVKTAPVPYLELSINQRHHSYLAQGIASMALFGHHWYSLRWFIYFCCMCMSVLPACTMCTTDVLYIEARRGVWIPRNWGKDGCELPCEFWEPDSGSSKSSNPLNCYTASPFPIHSCLESIFLGGKESHSSSLTFKLWKINTTTVSMTLGNC